jgi:SAM-dependent methyltransferase
VLELQLMVVGKYVMHGGVQGRDRLRLLSDVMGPYTRTLLNDVGIASGAICLDLGCGGGDVTFELARAVGPTGRVVSVDLDEIKLNLARQESQKMGLTNITFETRDVTTWEPEESFDAIYARFLLTHLANPEKVVAVMRRCLRPNGVMITEDIDFRGHFAEPECPALQRYIEFYTKSVQLRGADPNIGPRLPGLLRNTGLEGVQMNLFHPATLQGGIKLLTCVTLENIAETILADGLTTERELKETIKELYEFARDPHTVHGGPRVFQAWGRNISHSAQ